MLPRTSFWWCFPESGVFFDDISTYTEHMQHFCLFINKTQPGQRQIFCIVGRSRSLATTIYDCGGRGRHSRRPWIPSLRLAMRFLVASVSCPSWRYLKSGAFTDSATAKKLGTKRRRRLFGTPIVYCLPRRGRGLSRGFAPLEVKNRAKDGYTF